MAPSPTRPVFACKVCDVCSISSLCPLGWRDPAVRHVWVRWVCGSMAALQRRLEGAPCVYPGLCLCKVRVGLLPPPTLCLIRKDLMAYDLLITQDVVRFLVTEGRSTVSLANVLSTVETRQGSWQAPAQTRYKSLQVHLLSTVQVYSLSTLLKCFTTLVVKRKTVSDLDIVINWKHAGGFLHISGNTSFWEGKRCCRSGGRFSQG